MEEMHHLAKERIGMASEKMKTQYNARATGHDFNEGDKVWLWNPIRRKGLSKAADQLGSCREDRHVNRMALMDCTAMSRTLGRELRSFAGQQVSAQTVRRCLQQHGHSAWRP
ncbi:hypothetical protein TNCV_37911 [Trichonephila clavipes]|nr:hypothetical protein TNCV_37911 [Trichonephila clavipes]